MNDEWINEWTINRWTDRQSDKWMYRQTNRLMDRLNNKLISDN